MAAIMDVIRSDLGRETLESLGTRVGADPSIVQRVASMALPLLVGGLLGGGGQRAATPRANNGDGILRHVLGDRREAVEEGTARAQAGWIAGRSDRCLLRWRPC